MVDMKKEEEKGIGVPNGCDQEVARAIRALQDDWGPYSTKSKRYSIFSLVRRHIDPAWKKYVETLPKNIYEHSLCQAIVLSNLARKCGFSALEDWVIAATDIHQSNCEMSASEIDIKLLATLEAIRCLALACRLKQPKRQAISPLKMGGNWNVLRTRIGPYCELCGQPSELELLRSSRSRTMEDSNGSARLSARYCGAHRPKHHDNSFNSLYKKAFRRKEQFKNEIAQLEMQSCGVRKSLKSSGNAAVDLFYQNIITRNAICPGEEQALRDIASRLTTEKVSDRKKQIVGMLASGMTRADIENELGITRQAISKALKLIPNEFRVDKKNGTESVGTPTNFHAEWFDELLKPSLEDEQVDEIYLNDDGKLWTRDADKSTCYRGYVTPSQASNLIFWLARCIGTKVDNENPFLEGEFPGYNVRFTAITPPVTDNPCFAVLKKYRSEKDRRLV